MTRVLVADPDPLLVTAVLRGLEQLGLSAHGCSSATALEHHLRTESYDLLVLDSGYAEVQERHVGLARVVFTAAFLSEPVEKRLFRHFGLLRKPFTSVELSSVLHDELGWLGSRPASLVEALTRAHRSRASVTLAARLDRELGVLHVFEGEIVHAASGELQGEAALRLVLSEAKSVSERRNEGTPRTIHRPFRELLLDVLGELDQDEQSNGDGLAPDFRGTRALPRAR